MNRVEELQRERAHAFRAGAIIGAVLVLTWRGFRAIFHA